MTPLEQCQDALDHIVRVCGQSVRMSKRVYWVKARAQSALDGDDKWKEYDYPRNRVASEASVRKRLNAAKALLEVAECPDPGCGGQGWIAVQVSDDEQEQQQCQWCAEKDELLAVGK